MTYKKFLMNFDSINLFYLWNLVEIGIIRLPIGGSYWMLLWGNYNFPHLTIDYYVKKLKSKIISCYMGDIFTVIVNDYKNIKEVLSREEFAGRITNADFIKDRAFGKELGNEKYNYLLFFNKFAIL